MRCGRRAGARVRRLPCRALLAAAGALASLCASPLVASAGAAVTVTSLSNLHTLTHWAYPTSEALVRVSPSPRARALGRLRFLTSDEQAEPYVALAFEEGLPDGPWVRVELPGRPNGERGWVPASALGPLHDVRAYLLVDRHGERATLFADGRAAFSAPVGVGRPSLPTPAGEFYVTEKLVTLDDPAYGPYAIGTSAYAPTLSEWPGGGVVGIHGTNEPQLIPGRPSHGCIRMRNGDVARLWQEITVGTPIEIT